MFEKQMVIRSQGWVGKVEGRVRQVTDYTWSQSISGFYFPLPRYFKQPGDMQVLAVYKEPLGVAQGTDNGSVFVMENTSSTLRSPGCSKQEFKCFTSANSPNPVIVHNTDATGHGCPRTRFFVSEIVETQRALQLFRGPQLVGSQASSQTQAARIQSLGS